MRGHFERCLGMVWAREGEELKRGKSRGQDVRLGVTRKILSSWRNCNIKDAELETLEKGTAGAILHIWYWRGVHCDELPAGLDHALFDFAVAHGPKQAIATLHLALRVRPDAPYGRLIRAAETAALPELIGRLTTRREDRERALAVEAEARHMIQAQAA